MHTVVFIDKSFSEPEKGELGKKQQNTPGTFIEDTQVFADLQWIPVMWGSIFGWITVVCTKQLYKFKEG